MTNNGFYTAATLLISGALPAFTAEDMNIVLFMVDDMGVNDTSVRFLSGGSPLNAYYRTPNRIWSGWRKRGFVLRERMRIPFLLRRVSV